LVERAVDVRAIVRMCAPYALRSTPIFLLAFLMSIAGLLPAYFTGRIIDALSAHLTAEVRTSLIIYFCAAIVAGVLNILFTWAATALRESFALDIRSDMLDALYEAPYENVVAMGTGELTNRLSGDIDALSNMLQFSFFPMFSAVVMFITTLIAVFAINWQIGLIAIVSLCLLWLPTSVASRRLAIFRRELSEAKDRLDNCVTEGLSPGGLALVKTLRGEDHEYNRFVKAGQRVLTINVKYAILASGYSAVNSVLSAIGPVLSLGYGAYLIADGRLSIGMLVAVLSYQLRLVGPAGNLWSMQMQLAGVTAILRRVAAIRDIPSQESGVSSTNAFDISISNVTMSRGGKNVLHNFSLDIPAGAHVAVVGPSGAGKSTIASLLVRLIDPDRGVIRLGGVDIRTLPLDELRSAIFLVPQVPHVFDESIRYNLAYPDHQVPDDALSEIIGASLLTGLEHDISGLSGAARALSGGERQRLALARALLRPPQCLILDETATGVDPEMQRAILDNVRLRCRASTLVVIGHHVRLLSQMDLIVVVDGGRIAATGTHADLIRSCNMYKRLYLADSEEENGADLAPSGAAPQVRVG
jgi:ATP-binding cassette, subfamily B, bacterial